MQSESLHQITKGDSASHFHKIRLGDALSFVVDNRGKTPPLDDKGTHDLLEINAIVGQKKFPNFELVSKRVNSGVYESWFRKGHPKVGDVLFSTVGSIAEVAYVAEERGCIAQNLVALRPKADVLDGEFLYYTLSSFVVKQRIISLDISSVQPSIKLPHLMDFEIELPPISSQVKIASFLGKLDDKIALNRQINQTLEAMAQAIFKSWFVDFDPVKAKIAAIEAGQDPLRAAMSAISGKTDAELDAMPPPQYEELAATAALFPEELVESELGDVPKGWEVGMLGDICSFTAGSAFKPEHQGNTQGDYPFIKVSDMNLAGNEVFIQSANNYISKNLQSEIRAKLHPLGATVFAKIGVALISNRRRLLTTQTIIDNNLMSASPIDEKSGSYYLYSILSTIDFNVLVSGTALPYLNVSDIKKIPIICPQQDVCCAFEVKISSTFMLMQTIATQNLTLMLVRDSLLPKMLTGEIEVSGVLEG